MALSSAVDPGKSKVLLCNISCARRKSSLDGLHCSCKRSTSHFRACLIDWQVPTNQAMTLCTVSINCRKVAFSTISFTGWLFSIYSPTLDALSSSQH